MDIIISYLHQGLSAVLPFVILLGLLIFVHELGHFLVAKFFGVRVEVFSLGFGKKIFQYKKGDTNYCISVVPLGGYVKMFGDEPGLEITEENKRHSFNHKPVGQRIAVVLAGPMMNLFFAAFLFMLVAMVGEEKRQPVLGDVLHSSGAYEIGFRSGDRILEVANQPIQTWEDLQLIVEENPDKQLTFKVLRDKTGVQEVVTATPVLKDNPNPLTLRDKIGSIDGLIFRSQACTIGISDPESLATKSGLRNMDQIISVNGQTTKYWRDLKTIIAEAARNNPVLNFQVERSSEKSNKTESLTFTVNLSNTKTEVSVENIFSLIGFEDPELFVTRVVDKSPAQAAGILAGDKLVRINNRDLSNWDDVIAEVNLYKKNQPPLKITVLRNGQKEEFQITPKLTSQLTAQGQESESFTIGIIRFMDFVSPDTLIVKTLNPFLAIKIGAEKSWDITVMTVVSILRLVQNKISTKTIGGFIAIGQAASHTFQIGITHFLQMMAVISINLFILNLLPIPILDGGHLVFFIIEALKGAPLSLKKMEIAQQIGLVLLLALLALSLFNDFMRLFASPW